jgi:hypothetical protein
MCARVNNSALHVLSVLIFSAAYNFFHVLFTRSPATPYSTPLTTTATTITVFVSGCSAVVLPQIHYVVTAA